jgi:hypothetical protein
MKTPLIIWHVSRIHQFVMVGSWRGWTCSASVTCFMVAGHVNTSLSQMIECFEIAKDQSNINASSVYAFSMSLFCSVWSNCLWIVFYTRFNEAVYTHTHTHTHTLAFWSYNYAFASHFLNFFVCGRIFIWKIHYRLYLSSLYLPLLWYFLS